MQCLEYFDRSGRMYGIGPRIVVDASVVRPEHCCQVLPVLGVRGEGSRLSDDLSPVNRLAMF